MANDPVGTDFYRILNSRVLEEISKATLSLHVDLIYEPADVSQEMINETFSEMKKTINTYIDGQKETLIKLQEV